MAIPDIPEKVVLRVTKKFNWDVVTKKAYYLDVVALLFDLGFLEEEPEPEHTKKALESLVMNYDPEIDGEEVLGVFGGEMTAAIKVADPRFTFVTIEFSDNKNARRIAYLVKRSLSKKEP